MLHWVSANAQWNKYLVEKRKLQNTAAYSKEKADAHFKKTVPSFRETLYEFFSYSSKVVSSSAFILLALLVWKAIHL